MVEISYQLLNNMDKLSQWWHSLLATSDSPTHAGPQQGAWTPQPESAVTPQAPRMNAAQPGPTSAASGETTSVLPEQAIDKNEDPVAAFIRAFSASRQTPGAGMLN